MTVLATQRDLGARDSSGILDVDLNDPDLNHLVSTQVDDLVKYQIVQLLHRHPDAVGDASFFAAALGFHSAEYTNATLEELANCGILYREACQSSGKTLYCFSRDPTTRKRITRLCGLKNKSATYDGLLSLLASRSLRRAAKRAKEKPAFSA
ncbi:MAG: hypothetical protein M1343_09930 [Chloroflexi bacterium]|nr:hypothetical protein [Chloroflexota bacterium]MDA8187608.1 hypothetical protein [Dehalococcoidales bacterium]